MGDGTAGEHRRLDKVDRIRDAAEPGVIRRSFERLVDPLLFATTPQSVTRWHLFQSSLARKGNDPVQRYEDSDRTYHGVKSGPGDGSKGDEQKWQPARIIVESAETGPTERQNVTVLRELREPDYGGFGWGHNGHGTSYAAAAILADALNVDDAKFAADSEDETDRQLRENFCADVLSQMCDEWRLRRGAVLRWVRGWYAQHQITELPSAVATLPPIRLDRR